MVSRHICTRRKLIGDHFKQHKILVFGAGDEAIGATVGWRLAQAPNALVSVICRSNYDAVKAHGFQVASAKWGYGRFQPRDVHRSPMEIVDGPFDYIVCANKVGLDAEKDYQSLRPLVNDHTTLVSFQNGLDVETPLRRTFPKNTLISAIVYYSCQQPRPGFIIQEACIQPHLAGLALFDRNQTDASRFNTSSARLSRLLELGQGDLQPLDDLIIARWTKQLWNGAFNPLCAIFQQDTRQLLQDRFSGCGLVERLMSETVNVANAAGVVIDSTMPQKLIEVTMQSPPIKPSMLQDMLSNKPMEIEPLSGKICRLGLKLGVNVTELLKVYKELVKINGRLSIRDNMSVEA